MIGLKLTIEVGGFGVPKKRFDRRRENDDAGITGDFDKKKRARIYYYSYSKRQLHKPPVGEYVASPLLLRTLGKATTLLSLFSPFDLISHFLSHVTLTFLRRPVEATHSTIHHRRGTRNGQRSAVRRGKRGWE